MIAAVFRPLLSPDMSKTRPLNLRLGIQYVATLNSGTLTSSQSVVIQGDFTPRYFLPWAVLISNRNRLQARWTLGSGESFSFRYPGRIQLEREFDVGRVPLTPFVNAELIWASPPACGPSTEWKRAYSTVSTGLEGARSSRPTSRPSRSSTRRYAKSGGRRPVHCVQPW